MLQEDRFLHTAFDATAQGMKEGRVFPSRHIAFGEWIEQPVVGSNQLHDFDLQHRARCRVGKPDAAFAVQADHAFAGGIEHRFVIGLGAVDVTDRLPETAPVAIKLQQDSDLVRQDRLGRRLAQVIDGARFIGPCD